jgi:hypothetical protein
MCDSVVLNIIFSLILSFSNTEVIKKSVIAAGKHLRIGEYFVEKGYSVKKKIHVSHCQL